MIFFSDTTVCFFVLAPTYGAYLPAEQTLAPVKPLISIWPVTNHK